MPTGGLGTAAIIAGLGGQAVNLVSSLLDKRSAQKRLDQLSNTPYARYAVNPAWTQIYRSAMSTAANPQGFTGAETGTFQNNIARILATRGAMASRYGNVNRIISGMDVGDAINATNQFAVNDASILRKNKNDAYSRVGQAANVFQNTDNANTAAELHRRALMDQLYGNAVSTNTGYERNIIGNLSNDLIGAGVGSALTPKGSSNPYIFRASAQNPYWQNRSASFGDVNQIYNYQ